MKALTKLLLAAAVCAAADVAVSTALAQQTLATWWVNNQTNLPPPNPFTNNTANLNIIAGPMTKGPGIGEPSGTSEYGGNNWTNNAVGGSGSTDTEANAIAGGHYLTYSIQVAPGYTVSFSTNVLYYHVSGTGPGHGELQYSTDGINYTDVLAMPYAGGSGGSSATALMTNVLSGVAALQNIPSTVTNYFRIVNWGATGSSGTWYIYDNPPVGTNGFVVSGSVTPVPPSENLATWWVNNQTNLAPPNPFTNNTAAANITVGAMTKGSGIGEPTEPPNTAAITGPITSPAARAQPIPRPTRSPAVITLPTLSRPIPATPFPSSPTSFITMFRPPAQAKGNCNTQPTGSITPTSRP